MGNLNLCPIFSDTFLRFHDDSMYKAVYEKIYKPLGALLFANPSLKFSFYFTGTQIEFLKKQNSEFFELLKELISKKQIEIIGGGYYNPIFPILFPLDRSGQIEKLSLSIRQNFGRRPRGMKLFADSWDPSMISVLNDFNMDYVLLENSLLPPAKQLFLPVVMSDRGKTTTVLPVYNEFTVNKDESAKDYFTRILNSFEKLRSLESHLEENPDSSPERVIAIPFNDTTIAPFLDSSWFQEFFALVSESERLNFSLPHASIKSCNAFIQGYVHAGIGESIARWCFTPYESVEVSDGYPTNIYDYLQTYSASRLLYDRMIHVSLLLNQCRGDKMRKKAAREKLWAGQSGDAYICRSPNALSAFAARQDAYKNLTEAEKLVRECSNFKESVISYDYNGDGFKEYVCHLEKYNVCITPSGGTIFELDVMKAGGNYADNFSRIKKFDGIDDNYFRGIFVDHIFEESEAANYCKGEPCRNGLFSANIYREVAFSSQKQEILLETRTRFSTLDQPISLKKKYVVKSSGIQLQYILKNEGPVAVKAKFAVETNLAELNLLGSDYKPYNIELVSAGEILSGKSDIPCHATVEGGVIQKVSALQITDTNSNVSFVFAPNEEAGVTYFPVAFRRRNMEGDIVQNESRTFVSAFLWDLDLPAGMEVEKTISLSVSYIRRQRKN